MNPKKISVAVFAVIGLSFFAAHGGENSASAPDPETVFRAPPQSAMTGVWWHWMGSSITKEGIVKDLDWFKATGIASATVFGMCDICTPWATKIDDPPGGKIIAFTPEWWKMLAFACDEAEKRGIELGLHNCPGYTSTGGPWITPRLAMRELVFNVTNAEKQISLEASAWFPVQNGETGKFEKPKIPSRRTDLQEIAVVDGVRVQHIPMGAFTQPNQWEMFGLECDKMNPEAVAFHLDHVIGEMKKYLGGHVGKTLRFVLLDSYEAGRPTWTPRMREEFKARRGYDPLPFLPILGGFKVSAAPDAAAEKKFKADYDRTIKDLYRDVLFKLMREKLAAEGLEFACEPYGGPFDSRECAAHVDRLMTEFWYKPSVSTSAPRPLGWNKWTGPGGRRHNVIEAEAFTSGPPNCMWTETPRLLKAKANEQFARGINRMVLHTCPLQSWDDSLKPGKTMGRWGTHFGRNQTWAKSGKGFFDYLNRCQALLQWGEPCGDRLTFRETVPRGTHITALGRRAEGTSVFFVVNNSDKTAETSVDMPCKDRLPEWFDPVSGAISVLAVKNRGIPLCLPPRGCGFLVFRSEDKDASPREMADIQKSPSSSQTIQTLDSTWSVRFGGVETQMRKLTDWTASKNPEIRYFSGTAEYRTEFGYSGEQTSLRLSLGRCNGQIAKVSLNGCELGTLWCEPYEIALGEGCVRQGKNELKIEFTNVWANRLIGDEREEPDAEFVKAPYPGGWYLARYPEWFGGGLKNRPSKGRRCFTDWNYFMADSKLVPSGLLGPVRIRR